MRSKRKLRQNWICVAIFAFVPLVSYAGTASIGVGILDQSSGDEIHVDCVEWLADHTACQALQFVLYSGGKIKVLGSRMNNVNASAIEQKTAAPIAAEKHESIAPDRPFEISEDAYDDDGYGDASHSSIMAFTAVGMTLGVLVTGGITALVYKSKNDKMFASRPAFVPSIDVSTEQVSTNISYVRNVVDVVPSNNQQWNLFWSQALNETPEQRAAAFSSLYPSSVSGLYGVYVIPANYILTRIEYSNVTGTYNLVFVPPNMTAQYAHDLGVQEQLAQNKYNVEAANQNVVKSKNAAINKVAKNKQKIFWGVGLGTVGLFLLSPAIVDLIRDSVMYPAEAIRANLEKKQNARRTKRLATEWRAAWSALLIDQSAHPLVVSKKVFSAIQTALLAEK